MKDKQINWEAVHELVEELYRRYGKPDGTLFDISIAWKDSVTKVVEAVLEILGNLHGAHGESNK